ncbi:unnamed protein product [Ostreobium quekettii]|uniref:Peptidase S1 domain-containing protein n=1 Tax=Ostreobium quekettii TaxID=121088 RepID=A0A8S1J0D0_9CHLO|nr:unnamed protein product [Ostreobium quekettii]
MCTLNCCRSRHQLGNCSLRNRKCLVQHANVFWLDSWFKLCFSRWQTLKGLLYVWTYLQIMRAAKLILHPQWNGKFRDGFDMALVVLRKAVRNAVPILLPDGQSMIKPNTPVFALGWGLNFQLSVPTREWEQVPNSALQGIRMRIVDSRRCPLKLEEHLRPHMLCAYDAIQCPCKGSLFDFFCIRFSDCVPQHILNGTGFQLKGSSIFPFKMCLRSMFWNVANSEPPLLQSSFSPCLYCSEC